MIDWLHGLARRAPASGPRDGREPRAFPWEDVTLPPVSFRGNGDDGFEIRVRAMTKWFPGYRGGHFALADVTTFQDREAKLFENFLLSTHEPVMLAAFLRRALREQGKDRTVTLFDDQVMLRVQGAGADRWNVLFHSVPFHGADPEPFEVTFAATGDAIRQSIEELERLIPLLTPLQRVDP